jgi:c-di-GMP phosphodiesterase
MSELASSSNQQKADLTSTVYVGRQPIYTSDLKTHAFELLFRSSEENVAKIIDGERATAELCLNTFAEIGLERIVGCLPAFINVSENFLLHGHCFSLPKERVVIEILEDVRPTPDVLDAVSELQDVGYTIALDDFVYRPELLPLVELAHIVKVDLPLVPTDGLANQVSLLKKHDLQLLAEKVETEEEFETCKKLGFDYFQGYFFSRPTIVKGKKLPTNKVTMMRLVSQIQNPSVSLNEISDIILTEPVLAYKLLRYANSAFHGFAREIESIQHAVTLVGIRQIKTICSLTALSSAAGNKPEALVQTLLIRGKMAELLATQMNHGKTETFFMAGLFSGLDALLDLPMDEALEMVPLSKEIEDSIRSGAGKLGIVLNSVLAYERGDWDALSCPPLDAGAIRNAYLEAIDWAQQTLAKVMAIS